MNDERNSKENEVVKSNETPQTAKKIILLYSPLVVAYIIGQKILIEMPD